jgi:hypothetical protein
MRPSEELLQSVKWMCKFKILRRRQMSVDGFFATAAKDLVKTGRAVRGAFEKVGSDAPKLVKDVAADLPTIEAITNLVAPGAVALEETAFRVLSVIAVAVEAAGDAAQANGLSVAIDNALIVDVKAAIAAVKAAG